MIAFRMRLLAAFLTGSLLSSCADHEADVKKIDKRAYQIITNAQKVTLGKTEPFTIEQPSETLRRKLFSEQQLVNSEITSTITDQSPDKNYHYFDLPKSIPLSLTLPDAMQAAAQNSQEYQTRKEALFKTALDLDLEASQFRHSPAGLLNILSSSDQTDETSVTGSAGRTQLSLSEKFMTGIEFTTRVAVDLAKLLTPGKTSSLGIWGDTSILIPLLRGGGSKVVREPLTRAERNILYAIYDFEQFKAQFTTDIIRDYMQILQLKDQVGNAEENYNSLEEAIRRSKILAQAGRLPGYQVAQATQDTLRARNEWLRLSQDYAREVDNFKLRLGLPPDALIRLDQKELADPSLAGFQGINSKYPDMPLDSERLFLSPADKEDDVVLDDKVWLANALKNRLDLRIAEGKIYDARRKIEVAANALLPQVNLQLQGAFGQPRNLGDWGMEDGRFRLDKGYYSLDLNLGSQFNKTQEKIAYRYRLLDFEEAIRNYHHNEDRIKLEVRNALRKLAESKLQIIIYQQALEVAKSQVEATNMLLQSGRIEIRDLLEARATLVDAKDRFTDAKMNFKLAELVLMRVCGELQINNLGSFNPPTKAKGTSEQNTTRQTLIRPVIKVISHGKFQDHIW